MPFSKKSKIIPFPPSHLFIVYQYSMKAIPHYCILTHLSTSFEHLFWRLQDFLFIFFLLTVLRRNDDVYHHRIFIFNHFIIKWNQPRDLTHGWPSVNNEPLHCSVHGMPWHAWLGTSCIICTTPQLSRRNKYTLAGICIRFIGRQ